MKQSKLLFFLLILFAQYSLFAAIRLVPIQNSEYKKTDGALFIFDNTAYVVVDDNVVKSFVENIETYVGNHQYLISIPITKLSLIKNNIYYIEPESKIFDDINKTETVQDIQIQFAQDIVPEQAKEILKTIDASVYESFVEKNIYKAKMTNQQIQAIVKFPTVLWVAKDYRNKQSLVSDAYIMDRLPKVNMPLPNGFGLNGENMHIGIWDDGVIGTHINLEANRVFNIDKQFSFSPYNVHPVEVAGAAAMNGNTNYYQMGPAPKAKIYSWDYLGDIMQEIKSGIIKYKLNVTNHSYSFAVTTCQKGSGLYTPDAARLDKMAYDYPDVLHVVASGNTAHLCAVNDTFYSLDIGYQGTKNGITVGYLYKDERLVETSGSGPTTDGRLKPELVAKGFAYNATSPGNGFTTVWGSSFAAPQIAGIATLVQQKYKAQTGTFPPSSLVKAVLCNTAEDMYTKGIDYRSGFGRPDATKAIQNIIDKSYFIGNVTNQQQIKHQFVLTKPQDFLSITLCWTDPAAYALQSKVLVNDLDLKLVTPQNDTIYPWVLNPIIYKNQAKRSVDKMNNIEYISLDTALVGTYTILVNGTDIVTASQQYSISYVTDQNGIDIVFPDGGETIDGGSYANITWNARNSNDTLTFYYSVNNGTNWTIIGKALSSAPFFTWTIPIVNTKTALIKAEGATYKDSSNAVFNIVYRPTDASLAIAPCDKSVKLSWPAIANAQYYTIYLFDNYKWKKVDSISKLSYVISNLENGKSYAVAMTVTIADIESNRSVAKIFIPNFTVCSQSNDIGVYAIQKPIGGRMFTSSQLTNSEKPIFVIKNYGNNAVTNFLFSYQINNGVINTKTILRTINSNDTIQVSADTGLDFSNVENYNLRAFTSYPSDIIRTNDTLSYTIRQLANGPVILPWFEGFENTNAVLTTNTFGINGMDYADYNTTKNGRWWTRDNLYAKSGLQAMTLDNFNNSGSIINQYTMTLNMSRYKDSVVYLDFSYMLNGENSTNNIVYARGNDLATWIPIYNLFQNKTDNGIYKDAKSINLYKLLTVDKNQQLSSSFQIKFETNNLKASTELTKSGGYTFDDIKLYTANNDLANITPTGRVVLCQNETKNIPIIIKFINRSNEAKNNIKVSYIVNGGNKISEFIPNLIAPQDTFEYTFNKQLQITQPGKYEIITLTDMSNDEYKSNDTSGIITYILNQYIISLPYINNFESNSLFIPFGQNYSWICSVPNKSFTRYSAQGYKSWTNTAYETYNYNENSELYAGCYNLQNLNSVPSLAFNQLQDIENLYDSAWAEYSIDGIIWNKLGCANCGTNFYNNQGGNNKWDRILLPWQVASTKIKLNDTIADKSTVFIRIRLKSDEGTVGEGLAIDDWHVYIADFPIAPNDSVFVNVQSSGNGWTKVLKDGNIIAEIFDDNKNLGNISVGYLTTNDKRRNYNGKMLMQRNWSITTSNQLNGNFKVRLYLTNDEYLNFLSTDGNLFSMRDINALNYNGFNQDLIWKNNYINSGYTEIRPDSIYFVPYNNGYYVELKVNQFGEFYLLGKTKNAFFENLTNIVALSAQQINSDAFLTWEVKKDINVRKYNIQYSTDGTNFIVVDSIPSSQELLDTTVYNFIHQVNAVSGAVYYYRIEAVLNSGIKILSMVDSIRFDLPTNIKQNHYQLKAYFNQDKLNIETDNFLIGDFRLIIAQTDGKIIFQKNINLKNNETTVELPETIIAHHIYILGLQNKSNFYYSKLYKN